MKKFFLSFSIILLGAASPFAQADTLLEKKIRALDQAHAQAIFKGDAVALDSLMDDEVVVNHPTNKIVREKKELLDMIKKGVIRYSTFERIQDTILFYPGMVVVMGHEFVTPATGAPNAGKKLQRRYTNVWMQKAGKWQLRFRHANNVCE